MIEAPIWINDLKTLIEKLKSLSIGLKTVFNSQNENKSQQTHPIKKKNRRKKLKNPPRKTKHQNPLTINTKHKAGKQNTNQTTEKNYPSGKRSPNCDLTED